MNMQRRRRERRQGNLLVSLTNDAHDRSDRLFSPEVADVNGSRALENDANVPGLEVAASDVEVAGYLDAALISARQLVGAARSVRRTASRAKQAGMDAVHKLREASCR
jgi:hypothetical protein